jgi:hypothetical protein
MYQFRILTHRIRLFFGLPAPHPNPLARSKDPWIRHRTKMSRIDTVPIQGADNKLGQFLSQDI